MEFLLGLRVQAFKEMAEAETWDEFLQIKGSLKAIEAICGFNEDVEDTIRQKIEEEQERANNGNGE